MVFSSVTFIYLFLPICFLLYFIFPKIQQKNVVLTIMSVLFYAWGEPKWIILLIGCTIIHYFSALVIERHRGDGVAKAALTFAVAISLTSLFIFKYLDFTIYNINALFRHQANLIGLTLPIGISFYTFQLITYIVDVYRGTVTAQRNFVNLLLYVSMFPQLIAGPIVQYKDIEKQIQVRHFNGRRAGTGVLRFLVGLSKKAILANFAGQLATNYLDGDLANNTTVGAWIGIIAYAFQIYFDFSGYSDMAIGLGRIFGFDYNENFNYPYIAASINDFWSRWHISLTSFFREYLYIPLGGNRSHHVRNLFIVWFLTGLWHGASWNFIIWGLYYFILICVEKLFVGKILEKLPKCIGRIYTLFLVILGWAIFYFDDMDRLRTFFGSLFGIGNAGFYMATDGSTLLNYLWFFVIAVIACTPINKHIKTTFKNLGKMYPKLGQVNDIAILIWSVFLLLINTAAIVGSTYNPFLYFRF